MKKTILYLIIITFVATLQVGCNYEQDVILINYASGSYSGTDTDDTGDDQTWTSSLSIVWNGSSATVSGSVNGVTVTNNNGYVTVISAVNSVAYTVSGSGTGQLAIYSDYPFQLNLQGLTLSCSDGPAINNQSHEKCYVVISNTNTLSDGTTYASSTEDRKAAFFSEGSLYFSGSGVLTISGNYKHALASDDLICLCSGTTATLNLVANVSDGMHTNEGIQIAAGTVIVSAKDECIRTDYGAIEISGGTITAFSQSEAIESKSTLTISGGQVYAHAVDDAINSADDLIISGGYVCAYSTGNDGLDANGNCYILGGLVYAIGANSPEVAIDANEQKQLYVEGGTLVAIGGLENGASLSQACYSASSWSKSTWYALTVGTEVFAFQTPSSGGSTLVVSGASTPTLTSGVTASGTAIFNGMGYYPATVSGGTSVELSAYSGGNSGGGPGGDNPGGDGPGGNNPGGW